jgi:hypothetical protein
VSANKHLPHVLVLPEDDANRQLANGFALEVDFERQRRIQILPVVGGWLELLNRFKEDHCDALVRFPNRNLVLLIDFDNVPDRLDRCRREVPPEIAERVFILGVWSEPEALKQAGLGGYESIGAALAKQCREGVDTTWTHDLLRHNETELERLRQRVRPILF